MPIKAHFLAEWSISESFEMTVRTSMTTKSSR